MSTPENPLAQYRTYSYHHILAVCDNTTTAQKLAQSTTFANVLRFKEASARNKNDGLIKKFPVGDGESGSYAVVINTMVDADFIIESVRWSTVFSPKDSEASSAAGFTSFAVDGTMEIKEPQGILFLNVLNDIYDGLGVDPSGSVFMLKTIFVGHTSSGGTDVIYNIAPFLFVLIDVTGYFDTTGAGYTLAFVGVENGLTKMPQVAKVGQGVSFEPESTTLLSAFQTLENRLQQTYAKYVQDLKAELEKNNQALFPPGRKVAYLINLEYPYTTPGWNVDLNPTANKTKPDKDSAGNVAVTKDMDIEGVIHNIMRKCSAVQDDIKKVRDVPVGRINLSEGSLGKTRKVRYAYRVHSALESGPDARKKYSSRAPADTEYFFVYTISRYAVVSSSYEAIFEGRLDEIPPGDKIEFDYFFSGKNTDILEFDIKMQMGLAFLYTLNTTSNVSNSAQDVKAGAPSSKVQAPGTGEISSQKQTAIREKTPIMFSTNTQSASTRYSADPAGDTNFQALLSRFASIESLEAKVTIAGNPRLLANTTALEHTVSANSFQEGDVTLNWRRQPGLVKVNIYFPTPKNRRSSAPYNYEREDYSESFWYKGFYYLIGVEHIFEGGEFKQVLDMMSLPIDPLFEPPKSEERTTEEDVEKKAAESKGGSSQEDKDAGGWFSRLFGGS